MADEYYKTAIQEALGECAPEAWKLITDAQFDDITDWIENSIENRSLGTGSWAIPDPAEAREAELLKEIAELREQLATQERSHYSKVERIQSTHRSEMYDLSRELEKASK